MYGLSKSVLVFIVIQTLGVTGYMITQKLIFEGQKSLVAMISFLCALYVTMIPYAYLLKRFERLTRFRRRGAKRNNGVSVQGSSLDGVRFKLRKKDTWKFQSVAVLSLTADLLFTGAIVYHFPVGIGGLLSKGFGLLILHYGAVKLFDQKVSRGGMIAIFVGILGSCSMVFSTYLAKGYLEQSDVDYLFAVPVWVFFSLGSTAARNASTLMSRKLAESYSVGTILLETSRWGTLVTSITLFGLCFVQGIEVFVYPPFFLLGSVIGVSCLLIASTFRAIVRQRRLNPLIQQELGGGISLILLTSFELFYFKSFLGTGDAGAAVIISTSVGMLLCFLSPFLLALAEREGKKKKEST